MKPLDPTIHRTPVEVCPACQAQRIHSSDERALHHPLSGHGVHDSRRTYPAEPAGKDGQ